MKAQIDLSTCPLLTLRDIGELCRNLDLAKRGLYAGWLVPCIRTAKNTGEVNLFSRREVDGFLSRLIGGELPPQLSELSERRTAK